jgi:hypothetical protein
MDMTSRKTSPPNPSCPGACRARPAPECHEDQAAGRHTQHHQDDFQHERIISAGAQSMVADRDFVIDRSNKSPDETILEAAAILSLVRASIFALHALNAYRIVKDN